ncbi:hypothetical protein MCOR02_004792 [Pyricularia oryzae]|uniref:Kinesin motor domain-containing protein n=1 Tax=Pyricularia oryzae TaxID=318829 RepID=A0A4P7N1T3_PYROR|nr:hypothetical protein MCOR02_004792 [Pyricularia oryzae]KAI6279706.1 hypothetical protein MCOR34_011207 [Pyricularia oryzae]KAI6456078.1 hypothetical protein MCOR17_008405 [Pyricularia oryzae]KAI6478983.1 hypothetical protein MCOR13_011584 [Pyricularia oryzae]KAI6586482.1 hypothetical protein MCOR04_004475 [Pyricularia oryzae]
MESPFSPGTPGAASSPPNSPPGPTSYQRPLSAMVRSAPRSNSRLSTSSKFGGGSRASDDEARTSVRVAVRIRPPLRPTDPGFDLIPQRFQRSMVQVTSNTSLTIDAPQGRKLFVFDRVFGPEVNQEGIWDYLSDCVNAFVQGYNVSLLAYGQSGAGKSYTMGTAVPTDQDDFEMTGVIPRAATALFEKLDGTVPNKAGSNPNRGSMSQLRAPSRYNAAPIPSRNGEKNWSLKATYVEIYNEQLRDLLLPENIPTHERSAVTIREDVKGNIILTGLRQVEINSVEDLMNALSVGSALRQTDATAINARSSRSHAVFSLNLVQRNKKMTPAAEKRMSMPVESGNEAFVTTDSKLHFVDLAGSERLKNTGAQGERAKEGISINAGLAALGKVISQLSSRQAGAHVSYRDSRLTRLLQDSLGGNAITYMIACVTPAEFHLSETLNTVQYAQRARAIQSKPRIQQVEEGDKQAIIDRLKAEVAFLRDQIRSSERSDVDRRVLATGERSERPGEREVELQNQLLDFQENYSSLSQRHAKLIAEMAKARESEQDQQALEESLGDSATARLNRSNSFAQAVEQVVLEYEKTIQSLEQSLASTRATLSSTETSLLEKETKCAYVETISNQLQLRLQKMMDRENSTESYLHELESKLDGHTSGEEKNAAIVIELRKEIARVREAETTAEEYITTLEERLAEADQDAELMQREIDRLEQVIERQRSLGKLDSLLYELDHVKQEVEPEAEIANGGASRRSTSRSLSNHSRSHSHVSRHSHQKEDAIPEDEEDPSDHKIGTIQEDDRERAAHEEATAAGGQSAKSNGLAASPLDKENVPSSPAQTKFMADKLDTVSRELVDLRVEHEATVNDYEMLQAKYEEALRAMAELQDAVDEARHPQPRDSMISVTSQHTRPSSYLSDARSSMTKDGKHWSRSLSSELSSAMQTPTSVADGSDAETLVQKPTDAPSESIKFPDPSVPTPDDVPATRADQSDAQHSRSPSDANLRAELERLQALAAEKAAAEARLTEKYSQLEKQHSDALDIVEELRTEVAKVQAEAADPSSPRTSSPLIRRKSNQNVMMVDRAHRSFASLRNIATENFEENPDVMQNFTINLEAAMHELHTRSERIQQLEADVTAAKKEMETKMTIISGLTRERSSLKSSPMDISVISTLRDQLEKNEKERKEMQEAHSAREIELQSQLNSLRAEVEAAKTKHTSDTTELADTASSHEGKVAELQANLAEWEEKHRKTLESMQTTEQQMRKTIEDLEAQLAAIPAPDPAKEKEAELKQQNLVTALQNEIDEYKSIISSNSAKVAELEQGHAATRELLEQASQSRELATAELDLHQQLVSKLEAQIEEHEQSVKQYQEELAAIQENHIKELENVKATSKQEQDEAIERLTTEHSENVKVLEGELTEAREDLMKVATQVAFALGLDVSVEKITDRIEDLIADQKALSLEQQKTANLEKTNQELTNINDTIMRELEAVKSTLADLLTTPGEPLASPYPTVHEQLSAVRKRMGELDAKSKKNSRLVEELEDQLQSNFDQAQMATNRFSTLQTEQQSRVEEANAARIKVQSELDTIKEEYAALQAKFDGVIPNDVQRSNSITSGLRKSGSVASLPSPPPAIPLPPLPGTTSSSPPNVPGIPATPTGARPPSKDLAISMQIQQDQEARIRTIEKHLTAEKQLTATLEEALTDLEDQSKKVKADCDAWRRRCNELETEMKELKEKPQPDNRWSLHQVEEERRKRRDAELANARLEERMNAISKKNKKKGSLNCF